MTFNLWISGANVNNGLQKIAKHIALINPDIAALQEVVSIDALNNLTALLGDEWTGICHQSKDSPDVAIITKHEIHSQSYANTSRGIGVRILVDSWYFVNVWSVHLDYLSYGPYAAYNKLVTSMDQIMAGESPRSGQGASEIVGGDNMMKAPTILWSSGNHVCSGGDKPALNTLQTVNLIIENWIQELAKTLVVDEKEGKTCTEKSV
uniref:Endo/exonuclease/phosphatase domain-containing protein n=1 Tax=Angiostrongylus cantonensis TaxID=6313 RepID=A0A0K0DE11_ANGCA